MSGFDDNGHTSLDTGHTFPPMMDRQKLLNWVLMTIRESAWAPLSVFVLYLAVKALGAYQAYPWLDIPTHFLGGVAIAHFYRSTIANSRKVVGSIPLSIQIALTLTCTGTTTVLWEFFEYASDFFFHTNMINGLEDTLEDMLMGLLGGLILVLLTPKGRFHSVDSESN